MPGRRSSARPRIPHEDSDSPSPPPDPRRGQTFDVPSSDSDSEPAPGHGPDRAANHPAGLTAQAQEMFVNEPARQARVRQRAIDREREDQQDALTRPTPRSRPQGDDPPTHGSRPRPSHGHNRHAADRAHPTHGPSSLAARPSHHRPSHNDHARDRHGQHAQMTNGSRFSPPTHFLPDLDDAPYPYSDPYASDPHYDDGYGYDYGHGVDYGDPYYGESYSDQEIEEDYQRELAFIRGSFGVHGHGHGYGRDGYYY